MSVTMGPSEAEPRKLQLEVRRLELGGFKFTQACNVVKVRLGHKDPRRGTPPSPVGEGFGNTARLDHGLVTQAGTP
jgi:hypothetical protein